MLKLIGHINPFHIDGMRLSPNTCTYKYLPYKRHEIVSQNTHTHIPTHIYIFRLRRTLLMHEKAKDLYSHLVESIRRLDLLCIDQILTITVIVPNFDNNILKYYDN